MDEHLLKIMQAYDRAAALYKSGRDPVDEVPEEFRNSPEFKEFFESTADGSTNSSATENREFLDPEEGMKFLDAGCSANLSVWRYDLWPALYYGVDISAEIVTTMQEYAKKHNLVIGGLEVADLASLPYPDDFFDIASLIGVLGYSPLDYNRRALCELSRVLKPGARLVVDVPNPGHRHLEVMIQFEAYLGMTYIRKSRPDFEAILESFFKIKKIDDSRVMIKYFVEA